MILRARAAAVALAGALAGAVLAGALLSGCTSSGDPAPTPSVSPSGGLGGESGESSPSTAPTTVVRTSKPAVVTTGPVTETTVDACPYIGTQDAADAEGSRIGQVLLLRQAGRTVGCRFRFQYGDNHYTLEIMIKTYADAVTAHNTMVRQGSVGTGFFGVTLATGDQGVLYRTSFYPPDAGRDWACVFAQGRAVVTVKTDQDDTSADARGVAEIVAKNL